LVEGERRKRRQDGRLAMGLATPESVQRLRAALHAKAKGEPNYRFYMVYDKVYRRDVLAFAYECCRANRGAAGVDGRTFEDIEAYGVERWLGELTEDLKKKTYRPSAVRRVWIPKPDGRKRPLGIPTVLDRFIQQAVMQVLQGQWDGTFSPHSYGFRPGRSAPQAVAAERAAYRRRLPMGRGHRPGEVLGYRVILHSYS